MSPEEMMEELTAPKKARVSSQRCLPCSATQANDVLAEYGGRMILIDKDGVAVFMVQTDDGRLVEADRVWGM